MRKSRRNLTAWTAAFTIAALSIGGITVYGEESASAAEDVQTLNEVTDGGTGQLTAGDIQALNEDAAVIYEHNGHVTLVEGSCSEEPVHTMEEASAVIDSLTDLLGADEQTQFLPIREIEDVAGNHYFVFQQMVDDTTVCGGAVKVITDSEGQMTALSASVVSDLPEAEPTEAITAKEAEEIALQNGGKAGYGRLTLVEGATEKIILPMTLTVDDDLELEEADSSRYVWVVYTEQRAQGEGAVKVNDLPYLAHYVTLEGEYLYSLPTIMPGDESGSSGFDSSYVFEFMEPVDYTGYVDLADGTEQEVTVTVMRDRRTGMYYLGDPNRRIVVADCYEYLYNHGTVVLESSPDNREWDQTALLSLYTYSRIWDYYDAIGWNGGDGNGTPILILNDYRDEDGVQVDNAAFAGNYMGWSIFVSSRANDYAECLDVIAHEYTHCVTESVMTFNSYMNDYGAINEAISDIQGEVCEQMLDGNSDEDWQLGENSGETIRSLSDPNRYAQPAYTWDLYYTPNVEVPTVLNDQGGVHTNSSLLNVIAYDLCSDGGMTLEEARAYWFAVDCSMVPGTDYQQLSELLPFVLRAQGMDSYLPALEQALAETALGVDTLPESFQSNQALVTLTLPDEERFRDGSWALQVFTLDVDGLREKLHEIAERIKQEDYSVLPSVLSETIEAISEVSDGNYENVIPENWKEELLKWVYTTFREYYFSGMGAAGLDGRTIRMVCRPGHSLPVLMHMLFSEDSQVPEQVVMAIYFNGKWYQLDMQDSIQWVNENEEALNSEDGYEEIDLDTLPEVIENSALEEILSTLLEKWFTGEDPADIIDLLFPRIEAGDMLELASSGLDAIRIPEGKWDVFTMDEAMEEVPVRMSRPKEDAAA